MSSSHCRCRPARSRSKTSPSSTRSCSARRPRADLSDATLNLILEKIESGLPDGNLYSDASNATTRAAWKVVQNVASEKTEAQCREIIRTWVKNSLLVKTSYTNPKNRKPEQGLKLSPEKRQELDNQDRARRRKEATASRPSLDLEPDTLEHGEPQAALLTAWDKLALRSLGYTDEQIREMKPEEGQAILAHDRETPKPRFDGGTCSPDYHGPPVEVSDFGPDALDEHGQALNQDKQPSRK
jgi:hypothetical protein